MSKPRLQYDPTTRTRSLSLHTALPRHCFQTWSLFSHGSMLSMKNKPTHNNSHERIKGALSKAPQQFENTQFGCRPVVHGRGARSERWHVNWPSTPGGPRAVLSVSCLYGGVGRQGISPIDMAGTRSLSAVMFTPVDGTT